MTDKLSETAAPDSAPVQPPHTSAAPSSREADPSGVKIRHAPLPDWDTVDEAARAADSPESSEAVYAEALGRSDLDNAALDTLGQRYVAFLEEWYGDAEKPISVLKRVVSRDYRNRWALEKLSLLLTLAERWDELLATYDETLEHSTDLAQQVALLEEASRIAKDFAGQGQRASNYLKRLFLLKPTDSTLASSLERRLEQQERHQDLIDVWESRLGVVTGPSALELRIAIGNRHLQHLGEAEHALTSASALFLMPGGDGPACELLEKIALTEAATRATRQRALTLLTEHYSTRERVSDVVRVLTQSLHLAETTPDQIRFNQELVVWNIEAKDPAAAQAAAAEWLVLSPTDEEALTQLQALAAETRNYDHLAESIVRAAEATQRDAQRSELRLLAARSHDRLSGNKARAKELFGQVLASASSEPTQQLAAAQELTLLLVAPDDFAVRLDVLEQLAHLEGSVKAKRAALSEAAELAERTGDDARSLRLWADCLGLNPNDALAHDARVSILTRISDYPELLRALRARFVSREGEAESRPDLVKCARIHDEQLGDLAQATYVWQEIENVFGRNEETVDALIGLLQRANRWPELVSLLKSTEGSETDVARRATQLTLLGDVYRQHLDDPLGAVAQYSEALTLLPTFPSAREGANALLADPGVCALAAETLADAYRAAKEWGALVGLVETRFQSVETLAERQAVLLEAAEIAELHLQDSAQALDFVARAFALIPDPAVEQSLHRLAKATGRWEVAIDGYRRALEYSNDASRNLDLLLAQGQVHETELQEWRQALACYRQVLMLRASSIEGACATIRSSAETGDWDVACWAFVMSANAHGELLAAVTKSFEQAASVGDGLRWVSALDALPRIIAEADVPKRVSHDLKFQLAQWFAERTSAIQSAIEVLSEAVDEHRVAASLLMLVALQRPTPSHALVASLLKLSDVVEEPLPHLNEAARVALEHTPDPSVVRPILERALTRAEFLLNEDETHGEAAEVAAWSALRLVDMSVAAGDHATAFGLLTRVARLPLEAEFVRGLQHRAALTAASDLAQPAKAILLCKVILEGDPRRTATIALLARLYEDGGQLEALIQLRNAELGLTDVAERRLELRLEVSRVLGLIGDHEDLRFAALKDNLVELPGHAETIDAIASLLTPGARFDALYSLLIQQADAVNSLRNGRRAAQLFARAGELADISIGDVERALEAYRSSVSLDPTTGVLDALATIHSARQEHSEATAWLKQRYSLTSSDDSAARGDTLVRLGRSLRADEKREEAITFLEAGLREEPAATGVRELLAELREARSEWLEFATLLGEGVAFAADSPTKVRYLRRSAEIWWHQLGELETAVPLLERAFELESADQALRLTLAEALRLTDNLSRSRWILDSLLEEFGRRRTPERAKVHYQLALIERAEQRLSAALDQLDAASSILRSDPLILKTLGDVAAQNGELERAERAYRALLLLVGRSQRTESSIGESAILFELYRIAIGRDDQPRAKDLLDSALQAAEQDPSEARRLERALWDAERWELLLDALERRASRATTASERSEILRTQTEVLVRLGRAEAALDALLTVALQEDTEEHLDLAQRIAEQQGLTQRFLAAVVPVAESATTGSERSGRLWLRLGYFVESTGNGATAGSYFSRAQATGYHPEESFQAMLRLYAATDQSTELLSALEIYVSTPSDRVDAARQARARYELAELRLRTPHPTAAVIAQGVKELRDALEHAPDFPRARRLLHDLLPHVSPTPELADLAEDVGREEADKPLLLSALMFSVRGADTSLTRLEEAVALAAELQRDAEHTALLQRTIEFARSEGELARVIPTLVALADKAIAQGAFASAATLLEEAVDHAPGPEAYELELRLASVLHVGMGRPERAVTLYETLATREPADARAWGPLIQLHRELGNHTQLEAALSRAEKYVTAATERLALRLERIRLLLAAARNREAEETLRAILSEAPESEPAFELLFQLMESEQRGEELRDLLEHHLEAAISRRDEPGIVRHAVRLGKMLEAGDTHAAIRVYRTANAAARRNRPLLDALLRLLPEDDPGERADVLESLMPTENPEGVERVALQLAEMRAALGDTAGIERAYEVGFQTNPRSELLRVRLERWYEEREHWAPLADLYASDATHREDIEEANTRFFEAAQIYDERLGDAAAAAQIMERALVRLGPAPELLERLSSYWVTAGEPDRALKVLNEAIATTSRETETRAVFLHLRGAVLARSGEHDLEAISAAIVDLNEARQLGRDAVREDLAALLERKMQLASSAGNETLEREALVLLASELPPLGLASHALELLGQWLRNHPTDGEIGLLRAECAFEAKDYLAAASASLALFHASQGGARKAAALRYAQACEAASDPVAARSVLEQLYDEDKTDAEVGARLKRLYEDSSAFDALAELLIREADGTEARLERHALLLQAARMLSRSEVGQARAVGVFEAALALQPDEHQTVLGLSQAYTLNGNIEEACALLETAIKSHGKRRSRELSELQHAMSWVAKAAGDDDGRFAWLDAALQSDRRNGDVAAELAAFAMDRQDFDSAIKALQLITLLKEDCSMSRAEAYLRQAIIASQRSDNKKAALLAKRALSTDPDYEPAKAFLTSVGSS